MRLLSKTQQLERLLREDFASPAWEPGAKLPSEDALMERFGVSRPSMREALNTLAAEGILVRKHGSGTYLMRRPVDRIEVYLRIENVATVSGYWYRDILQDVQELGAERRLRVEPVVAFGETLEASLASIERTLSRPVDSDLAGVISLTMSEEMDEAIRRARPVPMGTVGLAPRRAEGLVVLDYEALADAFARTMRARGYDDFTVVFTGDPPEKTGKSNHRAIRELCDRMTGGDRARQLEIVAHFVHEADYQRHLEAKFLEWFRGPFRTRAAVFLDDGLFSNCCRVMARHRIQAPRDLAVLTHANVGREFDFPVKPDRGGFDPKAAAQALWRTLFTPTRQPIVIPPVLMDGETLPTVRTTREKEVAV